MSSSGRRRAAHRDGRHRGHVPRRSTTPWLDWYVGDGGVAGPCRRLRRSRAPARRSSTRIDGDYLNVVGLPVAAPARAPARSAWRRPSSRLRRLGAGPSARLVAPRRSPTLAGISGPAAAPAPYHGLLLLPHRVRRPRHGGRSRHGQHARLRARPRHRALRAERRRDRLADGRGPRRRHRGQAHARPHAGHDLGHPAAEGRRDRRLRRDGGDAPALHPEGAPEPLGAPARRRLRSLRGDRRREAGRRGGLPVAPARVRPT